MYNASYTVQNGDTIVALKEADRLFGIHHFGEHPYSLVWDIFAHGFMHGELMKVRILPRWIMMSS